MPLRTLDPSPGGDRLERLVQFTGGVVFGFRPTNQLDPGIESDDGVGVAAFDGIGIDRGNLVIESNPLVAAIEPPSGHLLAVPRRPVMNHFGPLLCKGNVDGLVFGPLRQAKRLLRADVPIRGLTR